MRATTAVFAVLTLLLLSCGPRLSEDVIAAAHLGGEDPTSRNGVPIGDADERDELGVAPSQEPEGARGRDPDPGSLPSGKDRIRADTSSPEAPSATGAVDTSDEPDAADGSDGNGAAQVRSKAPVVIGNVGTYSGVLGTVLEPGRVMAQVWVAHVNATGGLGGHQVELVTADDRGDPSRAQALVREMVEDNGVIGFVGNLTPYSTASYARYLEQAGVAVVGGDNWQRAWFESPMLFPHSTSIPTLIATRAKLNVQQGKERLGAVFCAEAEICRDVDVAFEEAARRGGGQAVFKAEASLAQPNFTAECISARRNDVEGLLMAMPADAIQRIMRDCTAQGFRPAYSACALCIPNPNALASDPNAEGFMVESAVFPWLLTDAGSTSEFAQAAATYAPDLEMSGATAQVWAAGKLLEAAVDHAGADDDLSADDLLRGLYALPAGFTTDGLTVPLTFREGEAPDIAACSFWATIRGGAWQAPDELEPTCV